MRNDIPTLVAEPGCDPVRGTVRWAPLQSLWWFAMAAGGVLAVTVCPSVDGLLLFLASSAVTVCLGHSLGMHRRLIHRSDDCPRPRRPASPAAARRCGIDAGSPSALHRIGCVTRVSVPSSLPPRDDLQALARDARDASQRDEPCHGPLDRIFWRVMS